MKNQEARKQRLIVRGRMRREKERKMREEEEERLRSENIGVKLFL